MDSSSYSSSSSSNRFMPNVEEDPRYNKTESSFNYTSIHGVRKPLMKKPIAPLPPMKPKVYKVEPEDFKKVVQRLTAAPGIQRRRLEEMAPSALDLPTASAGAGNNDFAAQQRAKVVMCSPKNFKNMFDFERNTPKLMENGGVLSPLAFSLLSPSFWNFSPLVSPGTLSLFDQSTFI